MISTAIEVQLVGQSPLVLILPALAIAISIVSIGLTLWFRHQDRFRLSAKISQSIILYGDEHAAGSNRVNVSVTNLSRAATTQITELVLGLPGGGAVATVKPASWDAVLPLTLGPGESAQISYPSDEVGKVLMNLPPAKRAWVRAKATSGHKVVFGKKRRKLPEALIGFSR